MFNKKFQITNINCSACVTLSEGSLTEIPGVKKVTIDSKTGDTVLEADREISEPEIIVALESVDKEVKF